MLPEHGKFHFYKSDSESPQIWLEIVHQRHKLAHYFVIPINS